jgi:hypothetical protein
MGSIPLEASVKKFGKKQARLMVDRERKKLLEEEIASLTSKLPGLKGEARLKCAQEIAEKRKAHGAIRLRTTKRA